MGTDETNEEPREDAVVEPSQAETAADQVDGIQIAIFPPPVEHVGSDGWVWFTFPPPVFMEFLPATKHDESEQQGRKE